MQYDAALNERNFDAERVYRIKLSMTEGGEAWKGGIGSQRFASGHKEGCHSVRCNQERWGGGRKGFRSVNITTGSWKKVGGNITSFYFTSFQERWSARDMLQIFDTQARVHEVVILARKNALSRRFGFVQFFDVKEMECLATILVNIFVEGEKIHVNLPRLQREVKQDRKKQPRVMIRLNESNQDTKVWTKKNEVFPRAKGTIGMDEASASKVERKGEGEWTCDIDIDPALKFTMVGDVITHGMSNFIQDELAQQGVFSIKATPMGSNLVLFEDDKEDGSFKEFIDEAWEWLYQWFKWIRPWKPLRLCSV